MALARFDYSQPCNFQGIEDLATDEMQDFALEMQRRLIQNTTSLINSIREQVIVDKDILPILNSGSTTETTINIVTSQESEGLQQEILLTGFY